jgi:hypothetical protein
LKTLSDELEKELDYYAKCFVIMYADDTPFLAESANYYIVYFAINMIHE